MDDFPNENMNIQPALEVQHIKKSYRKKVVLCDASFYANPGECVGIVGANGCGKSTLLGILSGTLSRDGGEVSYNGENPFHQRRLFDQLVGFIPQENPLMDHLSLEDNLAFWYCEGRRSLEKDFECGLPFQLGLTPYRHMDVGKLSGGLKKRLSIACALAKEPKILILDEPGASLDIICKEDIKKLMLSYTGGTAGTGNTCILTSHETGELSVCDRIYLLQDGVLREIPELAKNVRSNDDIGRFLLDNIRVTP
jgi:ABC-2 type transport system ATP-binding protein